MANFLLIADPDAERRRRFVAQVRSLLAPVEGLRAGDCAVGDVAILWAAAATAPVSSASGGDWAGVVWGLPIRGPAGEPVDALGLKEAWANAGSHTPEPWDGFYAAAACHVDRVVVGADLLGLYPVYYAGSTEVLVVGSSPALFRYHPTVRAELDPAGLVGLLLTAGVCHGNTLWRGVRRLSPGHLISWRQGVAPRESRQYEILTSERHALLPFDAQVALLADACDAAVARHAAAATDRENTALLLSGGRDSRLLAGFLARRSVPSRALTLGEPHDYDAVCAAYVARALGIAQTIEADAVDRFPRYAELQVAWEHLSNGMSSLYTWGIASHLRALGRYVSAAYLLDSPIGGFGQAWAREPATGDPTAEAFFAMVTRHGIVPERLRRLLRREVFGDLVDDTWARLRIEYEAGAGTELQRAWRFWLYHRGRLHAGGTPWRMTFGAWPVLPVLDRTLLEVAAGLSPATLADFRAEDRLLSTRFPKLARLPLDRNSADIEPLVPSAWWRIRRALKRLSHRLRDGPLAGAPERRRYYRLYDFNGPGWLAVRRHAEPYRERLAALCVPEVLNELLPPPEALTALRDPIIDSTGLKQLVGLFLWSRDYL